MQTVPLHRWIIPILVLLSINAFGQDNHYAWTQFGSLNSIINNASLSVYTDESAVIINPATLSLATQSSFNFNANALGYTRSKFSNETGAEYDISNTDVSVLPTTISGVIKPKKEGKSWILGYSFYTSNKDDLNFSYIAEEERNLIDDAESPGDEFYRAQSNILSKMHENSFVVGIGWDLGSNFSLGASQVFSHRKQEYTEVFAASVTPNPDSSTSFDLTGMNFSYITQFNRYMTRTTIGLSYKVKNLNIGLVISSPSLGLFGQGYIIADYSITNYRAGNDINAPRKNYAGSGDYRNLRTYYKYPLSAAFGISRAFGKVRIYGSLNWYAKLNTYNILDPGNEPFIQPPSEENNELTSQILHVWGKSRNIYNVSLAADWMFKDNSHLLVSIRTDFQYAEIDPFEGGFDLIFKQWDYYHFTLGTQRSIGKSDILIGLRYTYGKRSDFPQPISANDPTNEDYLSRFGGTGKIVTNGLQLMLSYTFNFGEFKL